MSIRLVPDMMLNNEHTQKYGSYPHEVSTVLWETDIKHIITLVIKSTCGFQICNKKTWPCGAGTTSLRKSCFSKTLKDEKNYLYKGKHMKMVQAEGTAIIKELCTLKVLKEQQGKNFNNGESIIT